MKFTTRKATGSTPDAASRARSATLPREAPPYHGKRRPTTRSAALPREAPPYHGKRRPTTGSAALPREASPYHGKRRPTTGSVALPREAGGLGGRRTEQPARHLTRPPGYAPVTAKASTHSHGAGQKSLGRPFLAPPAKTGRLHLEHLRISQHFWHHMQNRPAGASNTFAFASTFYCSLFQVESTLDSIIEFSAAYSDILTTLITQSGLPGPKCRESGPG